MLDKEYTENTEEKMLGDVYLEKNKKGEVVLCIAIGGGKVSKKVIKNNKNGDKK